MTRRPTLRQPGRARRPPRRSAPRGPRPGVGAQARCAALPPIGPAGCRAARPRRLPGGLRHLRHAHGRRLERGAVEPAEDRLGHREDRSRGPTGRCTSTWPRTATPTRRSRRSRSRPASRSTYSEDVDGNDTYYGKVQGQLANGDDIGQDIVTLTDWMAARMIPLGYTQELDQANIPNSENMLAEPAGRRLRPGPQALPHLAVRLRRHRLEQGGGARWAAHRLGPVEARAQGPGRGARRVARHHRSDHGRAGRRHLRRLGRRPSSAPRSRCWRSRSPAARSAR